MKLVVAVSGGVDSVVLLHMLVRQKITLQEEGLFSGFIPEEIIIAHFDHGMREESAGDARFVEGLAKMYGLEFASRREELAGVNEDVARARRYEFLFSVKNEQKANLVTAHHLDDLVETVALNVLRGARWRGLATMNDQRVLRPLLKRTKSELIEYALENRLEWAEDETNAQDTYKRNRIRKQLAPLSDASKQNMHELWRAQQLIRKSIGQEIEQQHFPVFDRYFMTMIEPVVAHELIYDHILKEHNVSLLGRQLELALYAIKVGREHTQWQIGQGVTIFMNKRKWYVQDES